MADARTLLRAKRQEARISHRYAAYNPSGQLRCTACGITIKHASAWEGHLGSKAHRTSVARLRAEEQRMEEPNQPERPLKRQTPDTEDTGDISLKKRKLGEIEHALPADFFSQPRDASPVEVESENENAEVKPTASAGASADLELEYKRFQRELLTLPDPLEAYERATVVAEAQLIPEESQEGFPAEVATEAQPNAQKEEERRRDEDERELILDRLLDEERAQEDADMRVDLMKKRLEAVKRKRQQRMSTELEYVFCYPSTSHLFLIRLQNLKDPSIATSPFLVYAPS
jgi:zinc finger protein 830